MICPKCLHPNSLKQIVHVIVECPADVPNLNKTTFRKKEVQIKGVDWGKAIYFCASCGYSEVHKDG